MRPKRDGYGMNRLLLGSGYVNGNEMGGPTTQRVSLNSSMLSPHLPHPPGPFSIIDYRSLITMIKLTQNLGIWLSPQGPTSNPFFTFVGSSNLSNRSLKYDAELSLLLMTSSPSLRKALGQEVQNLNLNARDVGEETWKLEERRVSWLAWLLIKIGVEGYL